MSVIYYKFKSKSNFDTVKFDGNAITLLELKRSIITQDKLGQGEDLQVCNAQTNEVYTNETVAIPRNTSVVVKRVPATTPRNWYEMRPAVSAALQSQQQKAQASLHNPNATEEEKIRAISSISGAAFGVAASAAAVGLPRTTGGPTAGYQPRFQKAGIRTPAPTDLPAETYTCNRCGQKGHFIQYCPTNANPAFDIPKTKRATGIPKSFLSSTTVASTTPNDGTREFKKNIPSTEESSRPVPDEMKCPICGEALNEAVDVACCGTSFCDSCIRPYVNEHYKCYSCQQDCGDDEISPNRELRKKVAFFLAGLDETVEPQVANDETAATTPSNDTEPKVESILSSPPPSQSAGETLKPSNDSETNGNNHNSSNDNNDSTTISMNVDHNGENGMNNTDQVENHSGNKEEVSTISEQPEKVEEMQVEAKEDQRKETKDQNEAEKDEPKDRETEMDGEKEKEKDKDKEEEKGKDMETQQNEKQNVNENVPYYKQSQYYNNYNNYSNPHHQQHHHHQYPVPMMGMPMPMNMHGMMPPMPMGMPGAFPPYGNPMMGGVPFYPPYPGYLPPRPYGSRPFNGYNNLASKRGTEYDSDSRKKSRKDSASDSDGDDHKRRSREKSSHGDRDRDKDRERDRERDKDGDRDKERDRDRDRDRRDRDRDRDRERDRDRDRDRDRERDKERSRDKERDKSRSSSSSSSSSSRRH